MSNQNEQISPPLQSIAPGPEDEPKATRGERQHPKKKATRRKKRRNLPTPEQIAALKQQAATFRKYLRAKRRRDEAFAELAQELNALWRDVLTRSYTPFDSQWKIWLAVFSTDEIEQAIYAAGSKYRAGHFDEYQDVAIRELIPYVTGIMKRRRQQQAAGLCPSCGQPV